MTAGRFPEGFLWGAATSALRPRPGRLRGAEAHGQGLGAMVGEVIAANGLPAVAAWARRDG